MSGVSPVSFHWNRAKSYEGWSLNAFTMKAPSSQNMKKRIVLGINQENFNNSGEMSREMGSRGGRAMLLLPSYQQLWPTSATHVFTFPRLIHFLQFFDVFCISRDSESTNCFPIVLSYTQSRRSIFWTNSEDKSKSVLNDLGCKRRISNFPKKGLVGDFSRIGDQFKSQWAGN